VVVEGEGFPDVVLWNPGREKGRALSDLGPDEYRRMLCVEAAVVGKPVHLAAGARWAGRQHLQAGPRAGATRLPGAATEAGPERAGPL
jgi:glucose-6-phosphate 1-epimerase